MATDTLLRRSVVAIALVSVVILAVTTAAAASPRWRRAIGLIPTQTASYRAGETIDLPASAYNRAPFTLVIFASADCSVCQRARPSLGEIIQAAERLTDTDVRLVSGNTSLDRERAFMQSVGLTEASWLPVTLRGLRVRRVPTIVLINHLGVVIQTWDGLPTDPQAVIESLTSHTMPQ